MPLEGAAAPFVYEPDGEHTQENNHRPEAEHPNRAEAHSPWEQERHFEVFMNKP